MKIAVTSEGTTPDSLVEWRFGRGQYFLIFDTESRLWEPMTVLNEAAQARDGAGTQAAQTVIRTGAEAVIAGHVGPKAFNALEEGGVRFYSLGGKTATEAVRAFTANELQAFIGPDLCSATQGRSKSTD